MTFNPDNPREEIEASKKRRWIANSELPVDVPVKLQVLDVVPVNDDDSNFFMQCLIHDGEYKGLTTRLYWWRFKKNKKGPRTDFQSLCKALLSDKFRNSEPIHSFHFKDKVFKTTPKEINDFRLFLKFEEIRE